MIAITVVDSRLFISIIIFPRVEIFKEPLVFHYHYSIDCLIIDLLLFILMLSFDDYYQLLNYHQLTVHHSNTSSLTFQLVLIPLITMNDYESL